MPAAPRKTATPAAKSAASRLIDAVEADAKKIEHDIAAEVVKIEGEVKAAEKASGALRTNLTSGLATAGGVLTLVHPGFHLPASAETGVTVVAFAGALAAQLLHIHHSAKAAGK